MLDATTRADDSAIWSHETGETFGEARERFATFGPALTAIQALHALTADPSLTVMSFGYGDDPEAFDEVDDTALRDAIAEDGEAAVDNYWGPFAVWANDPHLSAEDIIAGVLSATNGASYEDTAAAILSALESAGHYVVDVNPFGECNAASDGHVISTSLCAGCLEYVG